MFTYDTKMITPTIPYRWLSDFASIASLWKILIGMKRTIIYRFDTICALISKYYSTVNGNRYRERQRWGRYIRSSKLSRFQSIVTLIARIYCRKTRRKTVQYFIIWSILSKHSKLTKSRSISVCRNTVRPIWKFVTYSIGWNNRLCFVTVVKPLSARFKIIFTESNEPRIPKLLFDFVLQDAAFQLSHQQYLALVQLLKSFKRISINRCNIA